MEMNLELWVTTSMNEEYAIDVIALWIYEYYAGAKELYGANSEDNCMMILTIIDLWMALDRLAMQWCPLLEGYSSEIASEFCQDLLLYWLSTINCVLDIEEYLGGCDTTALKVWSVFLKEVDDSCFTVKYFQTLPGLYCVWDEIELHAQQE